MALDNLLPVLGKTLPSVNATLNGLSGVLLLVGFLFIKKEPKSIAAHRFAMLSACTVSALFLCCYLLRVALTGTHSFPGHGLWRSVYLGILVTHMLLAATVPFMAVRAVQHAFGKRFAEHRRLVRYLFPVWLYVSVTGVIVYYMLYHAHLQ
jgi:putative membrane protein